MAGGFSILRPRAGRALAAVVISKESTGEALQVTLAAYLSEGGSTRCTKVDYI